MTMYCNPRVEQVQFTTALVRCYENHPRSIPLGPLVLLLPYPLPSWAMQVFISSFCELLCQSQNYVREAVVFSWWVDSGGLSGGWSMRFKSLEKGWLWRLCFVVKLPFKISRGCNHQVKHRFWAISHFPLGAMMTCILLRYLRLATGSAGLGQLGRQLGR